MAWARGLPFAMLAVAAVFGHGPNTPLVASTAAHSEPRTSFASDASPGHVAPGWSLAGAWTGVAAEENSSTYALGGGGRSVELDASGKIVREVTRLSGG